MNTIRYLNILISYLCVIPVCIYLFSFNHLFNKNKIIFIYLCGCLFAELIMEINRYYSFINQIYLIYLFVYFEIAMFILFFHKYLSKTIVLILTLIVVLMLSSLLISIYMNQDPLNSMLSIQLGTGRLILLLMSINVLLRSFEVKIEKWKKTVIIALLIYSILGITIYAFAEFFAHYNEYAIYFYIINATSNLVFYILITLSIIQCKKLYYQA
jgi:hypothetical protein